MANNMAQSIPPTSDTRTHVKLFTCGLTLQIHFDHTSLFLLCTIYILTCTNDISSHKWSTNLPANLMTMHKIFYNLH